MKSLLLIRHAKSSSAGFSQQDIERTLAKSGERDAMKMANELRQKNVSIDSIISSPAARTFATAQLFAFEFKIEKDAIVQLENLYEPALNAFYDAISMADNHFRSIAVFSHNPGITSFVNLLTETQIDNMPTCGIFAVNVLTESWKDFPSAEKKFWFFAAPKTQ